MRLIDAEELARLFNGQIEQGVGVIDAFDAFYDALQDTPTVDAVEVVRCRDCRSYNKPKTGWCEVHLDCEHPDDYCSYGERKDGGGEDG